MDAATSVHAPRPFADSMAASSSLHNNVVLAAGILYGDLARSKEIPYSLCGLQLID